MASQKDLNDIDVAWERLFRWAGFPQGGVPLTTLIQAETTVEVSALHVDTINGSDRNPGTVSFPLRTLQAALKLIPFTVNHGVSITVTGTVTEDIRIPPIVPLYGDLTIVGGTIPDYVPRTLTYREFLYRTTPPTDGYHNVGSIVFDISGATIGWICTLEGTPGTWTPWTGGGGGGGITTMLPIGSTPNANGATISGATLTLQPASASFGGAVTTGPQTLAGDKNFTGSVTTPTLVIGTNKISYAATYPVSGVWNQGDVIYNTTPVSGGHVGWVCVTSSSPGPMVWREFGLISLA